VRNLETFETLLLQKGLRWRKQAQKGLKSSSNECLIMKLLNVKKKAALYRAFGKSKFASGVSILGSRQFSLHPSSL